MDGARPTRVAFRNCRLTGIQLIEAELNDVRFSECNLTGAAKCRHHGMSLLHFGVGGWTSEIRSALKAIVSGDWKSVQMDIHLQMKDRLAVERPHRPPMLSLTERQQIEKTITLVHDLMGADLLGVYSFGSATLGGLQVESDLDLLVLSKRPTSREEKKRLVSFLLDESGRESARGKNRRIELTIVVEGEIKPWRYPPRFDFQFGDWLRSDFEDGSLEPWATTTRPDLAVLIAMVLLANRPFFGPPPTEVFDPVPERDLERAMIGEMDGLRSDLESDTRNVILTFARIWTSLATGIINSKGAAANWALERLPNEHRPVLTRARAIYLGEQAEQWDDLRYRTGAFVDYVIAEIRRLKLAGSERT